VRSASFVLRSAAGQPTEHATGLEPGVESLVAEGGEEPASGLAARGQQLEQEQERLVEEARDLSTEVQRAGGALTGVAAKLVSEVRNR